LLLRGEDLLSPFDQRVDDFDVELVDFPRLEVEELDEERLVPPPPAADVFRGVDGDFPGSGSGSRWISMSIRSKSSSVRSTFTPDLRSACQMPNRSARAGGFGGVPSGCPRRPSVVAGRDAPDVLQRLGLDLPQLGRVVLEPLRTSEPFTVGVAEPDPGHAISSHR
jgi:hypothetical protein